MFKFRATQGFGMLGLIISVAIMAVLTLMTLKLYFDSGNPKESSIVEEGSSATQKAEDLKDQIENNNQNYDYFNQ